MLTCQNELKNRLQHLIPTTLYFQAVEQLLQLCSNDCRAFALAFAASHCQGIIPSSLYLTRIHLDAAAPF